MKKVLCMALAMLMVLSMFTVVSAGTTFYYVSVDGNDSNAGSNAAPFATLNAAVNAAKANGGTIIVKSGEYALGDTIVLGANEGNIKIYGEGDVVITGGTKIPYEAFSKVTDEAVLDRIIDSKGKKAVMSVNLKELGVTELTGLRPQGFMGVMDDAGYDPNNTFMEDGTKRGHAATLTYNDSYLTVAEYPNNDYVLTGEIKADNIYGENGYHRNIKYTVKDQRWRKWADAKDVWAFAYYSVDWKETVSPVAIDENGIISTSSNSDVVADRRVRFMNLLEELDVPGEYYLDVESGILYIIPPKDFKAGEYLVYSGHAKDVFQLNGTKNVYIQGIRFEGTTEMVIRAEKTDGLHINDCEFTAIGDSVIKITGAYNTTIENSYFHDLGSNGVFVYNCGDRQNLVSGNNKIVNCHFEDYSQYRTTYTPAIHMYRDVGTLVSHCEINNAPHFAIRYDSNDSIIEYCDFHHVCLDTNDSGAVYSGRYYNTWGNQIRYNYFHDLTMMSGNNTGMEMQAVYLDDMHSQTKVFGNVFYKVDSIALYGGGRNNTFENNIMVDNEKPFVFDARATTWSSPEGALPNSNTVDWHTDVWAEKYPELMNLEKDEPAIPKYNVIRNNVRFDTPDYELDPLVVEYGTIENNIEINDKKAFVKYGEDFTVAEDSVIFEKLPDFEPIPFKEIGTYDYEAPAIPVPGADDTTPVAPEKPVDNTIKVLLNDEPIDFADVEPQIINDRTMVPLRAIFEALGATVEWDDATKTVTAVRGDVTIKMTIGKDSFTRNDESVALDSPATIVDSRTLVPVRAIAESFGCEVGWIAETKTVTIKAEEPVVEEEPAEDAEAVEGEEEATEDAEVVEGEEEATEDAETAESEETTEEATEEVAEDAEASEETEEVTEEKTEE